MERVVGIGEYIISDKSDDVIKTFALGSCVALTAYNHDKRVLGMAHIVLPEADLNREDSKNRLGYFANTAVPLIINKMCSYYGCSKEDLVINVFGGAQSIIENDVFNIGRKNVDAVMKILNDYNMRCNIVETGGRVSRTLEIDVASGKPKVYRSPMNIHPVKEGS